MIRTIRTICAAIFLTALTGAAVQAATFTVTNTNDSGSGSLRAAITSANGSAGPHTINFTVTGTITPLSALPTVTQPTTIQPPTVAQIVLSGSSAGASVNGLTLNANGCVVRSMIVRNFSGNGIVVSSNSNTIGGTGAQRNVISANGGAGILVNGSSNTIAFNRIGTDNNGNLDNGNTGNGITINTASNTIDSNIIGGNNGAGVVINGASAIGNVVKNNFIGLRGDATGTVGNSGNGITLSGTGANTIGLANVISGNGGVGILITGGAGGTDIIGNAIGTNLEQTGAMANASHGVEIDGSPNNRVGVDAEQGTTNTISGNGGNGVFVHGVSTGTKILGNAIGYRQDGTAAVPNTLRGIAVVGSSNITIGDPVPGLDNTIAGNGQDGVYISGGSNNIVYTNEIGITLGNHAVPNNGAGIFLENTTNALLDTSLIGGNAGNGIRVVGGSGAVIIGNVIGLDLAGTSAVGNGANGISLENTTGNTIGQPLSGKGNTISGNGGAGIWMTGSTNNVIDAAVIGLSVGLTTTVPNASDGIFLQGSSNNQIGGTATSYISGNGGTGVAILSGTGNKIRGNSTRIFSNGGIGIDLDRNGALPLDGVNYNDPTDADTGANNLLNAPVLTAATATSVSGRLRGTPNVQHTIDVYSSTSCDPAGFGEGAAWLLSTTATTNASGTATFSVQGWNAVANTSAYAAIATDPNGNTSEFSQCISPGKRPVQTLTLFNTTTGAAALTGTLTNPLPSSAVTTYTPGPPLGGQQASWVMGDWDGDGIKTPGAYASGGAFFFTNDTGPTNNWLGIWFGFQNRQAVAGRFDGAVNHDCAGVVDSAVIGGETAFAVYYTCIMANGNPTKQSIWLGTPLSTAGFGNIGAHQFTAGDFVGNGVDTIAVRRGPYIAWGGTSAQYFGAPGTGYGNVVAGDWDGDGKSSFGLLYQDGSFYRLNDLDWHTEAYVLQQLGQPIGTPTTPASWRPGGS